MFVRKKKNKSGSTSIQVIDKSNGCYRVIKTIGSSTERKAIEELYYEGQHFIKNYLNQQSLVFPDKDFSETVKDCIRGVYIEGVNLLLGKIYDDIGFNKIDSQLLKQLVLLRISHPSSKLKTTQLLKRYFSICIGKDTIYRCLDNVYQIQKDEIQQISYTNFISKCPLS